jgi:hypothetical protein
MEGLNDDIRPIPRTTTAWKPFRIPIRRLIPIQPGRRRPPQEQSSAALGSKG